MPDLASLKCSEISETYTFNESKNQLEITWADTLGTPYLLVIDDWCKGLSWQLSIGEGHRKKDASSLIGYGIDRFIASDIPGVRRWWAGFPADIAEKLQAYKYNRFEVAKLCYRYSEAIDLLHSNPLLLLIISIKARTNCLIKDDLIYLFRLKQVQVLGKLGFPENPTTIKLLNKVNLIEGITKITIWNIMAVISDRDKVSSLRHLPSINLRTFKLLIQHDWMTEGSILLTLNKIVAPDELRRAESLIADSLVMAHQHGWNVINDLKCCKNLNMIRRVHDRLADRDREIRSFEILREDEERKRDKKRTKKPVEKCYLASPPHPGNQYITPLSGKLAILEEGMQMKHCITSYINRVKKGTYYVYKMESPERLTIGVKCRRGVFLGLDEVNGYRNKEPSDLAMRLVEAWANSIKNPQKACVTEEAG